MKKRKHLTQVEVDKLIEQAKKGRHANRNVCIINMLYMHGLRVSELSNLQLSDIDLASGTLFINRLKSGLSTNHPIPAGELEALSTWVNKERQGWKTQSAWLFLSQKGGRLSRQQLYDIIRKIGELAGMGIAIHPHMLRHACGFALADRGVDTRLIQDYLGHRNIRHTVHYTASNAGRFFGVWERKSLICNKVK
ncbi:tyrosine-type DNA invertase [Serratia bockelmannii]|uniref:tyrosine-type DNA invertase n=1 Tax=Serratia bockelmannii TaxID=2703793 RepID=UPI003FA7E560